MKMENAPFWWLNAKTTFNDTIVCISVFFPKLSIFHVGKLAQQNVDLNFHSFSFSLCVKIVNFEFLPATMM